MALVENKKAHHDFEILEEIEAGISLLGHETKAVRNKLGSLQGARVIVRGGEALLIGATIPPYQPANTPDEYDPERPRTLLVHKTEMARLAESEDQKGLTAIPLAMYNKGRYIKLSIGIARGKKKFDKREDIKKRDVKRDIARELKSSSK